MPSVLSSTTRRRLRAHAAAATRITNEETQVTYTVRLATGVAATLEAYCAQYQTNIEAVFRLAIANVLASKRLLTMESKLQFGKYKGQIVRSVIQHDPAYFNWLLANVNGIFVDEQVQTLLDSSTGGQL